MLPRLCRMAGVNTLTTTPPPPRPHWASSPTGSCWCGAEATEAHALEKNGPPPPGHTQPGSREG